MVVVEQWSFWSVIFNLDVVGTMANGNGIIGAFVGDKDPGLAIGAGSMELVDAFPNKGVATTCDDVDAPG